MAKENERADREADMSEDKIHIHIDAAEKRSNLPEFNQIAPCPKCGGETEQGFGLAGGGYGVYSYCSKCEIVTSKSEVGE